MPLSRKRRRYGRSTMYGRRRRRIYKRYARRRKYVRRYKRRPVLRRALRRRSYKRRGVKKQPIFFHSTDGSFSELITTGANPISASNQQGMFTSLPLQMISPQQVAAMQANILDPAKSIQTGLNTVINTFREQAIRVTKVYGILNFTSVGNFPAYVEVWLCKPRRNIEDLDITAVDQIVPLTMGTGANLGSMEPALFGSAVMGYQVYGMSPLHYPEFTVRYRARRVFKQMMAAGSTAQIPYKFKGFRIDRRSMASYGTDCLQSTITRFFLFVVRGIPVGAKSTDATPVEGVSAAPWKIVYVNDCWWKMYGGFDEGYRIYYQAGTSLFPSGNQTLSATSVQYMNPDTLAAANFAEAAP